MAMKSQSPVTVYTSATPSTAARSDPRCARPSRVDSTRMKAVSTAPSVSVLILQCQTWLTGLSHVGLELRMLTMGPFYPIGVDYRGHGPAFAVAFLLPFIGGIALDVRLHTVPFFITVGSIVGVLAFVAVFLFYSKDFR